MSELQGDFKRELQGKIMTRIARHERRVLILKTGSFAIIFAGSATFLVMAYFNLISALTQSGFFSFASLFFSDFGASMANFQDYAFSILESFPVFSAAFLVGGLIVVIWSATHLIADIGHIRYDHEGLLQTT
jgi:hypothetical protein